MSGFFGTSLVGEEFVPTGVGVGLIIVHGMAEHRGRYANAVQRFNAAGIGAITFDLRGHGQSPGERTHVDRFQDFIDDLLAIRSGVESKYPDIPWFIWGHSLGSLVVIRSIEQRAAGLRGAITSGCPLAAFPQLPMVLRGTVRTLCSAFPHRRVNPGLPADRLSHSAIVQAAYVGDPLVPKDVTVRLLLKIEAACRSALAHLPEVTLPWLALHGGADRIAPPSGSEKLVAALGSTDKTLELFAGMRHEVHNEIEPTATGFYERVIHWIRQRAP